MRNFFSLLTFALLASAAELEGRQEAAPAVITVTRVYHTVVDQSPFLAEATSTIVWTQSPSITDSQPAPTELPTGLPAEASLSALAEISSTAVAPEASSSAPI